MKYTEIQEPIDAQDKMIFFKSFQKSLIITFIVGGVGFILLLFDFLYYNKFQEVGWYVVVLVVPLFIFLISLGNFDQKLGIKYKQIIMGTVIDKKHDVDSRKIVSDEGVRYEQTHHYHLFIEGKDKPIEVSEELFNFLQKQDTMKLHYINEIMYRYEKNV